MLGRIFYKCTYTRKLTVVLSISTDAHMALGSFYIYYMYLSFNALSSYMALPDKSISSNLNQLLLGG